jgi:hypothetical protein
MTTSATAPGPAGPGTSARGRKRSHVDWELVDCGLNGHYLVGTDAAEVRPEDDLVVREVDGVLTPCCSAWRPSGSGWAGAGLST